MTLNKEMKDILCMYKWCVASATMFERNSEQVIQISYVKQYNLIESGTTWKKHEVRPQYIDIIKL